MTDDQADIVAVLTKDHREVEDIFGRIEAVKDTAERAELVEQATIELVRHSVAEEMWLYPTIRQKVPGGGELADREISEHAEVERLLKELERMGPQDPLYVSRVTTLMVEVRHHVNEEEMELFPKLRAATNDDQRRQLGERIQDAKRSAPTRPHPSSPSKPPANKILAPGVGLIDRLRDALTGRG